MTINEGSEIVPLDVLCGLLDPQGDADVPDDYNRVQLLTEMAYRDLVFNWYDKSYLDYGSLSKDFPLCMDFAKICASDVLRGSVKLGLAVRPAFGILSYTKTSKSRHAINWAVTVDRRISFYEPQKNEWLAQPKECKTMDRFQL